jgi:hypothetical protein
MPDKEFTLPKVYKDTMANIDEILHISGMLMVDKARLILATNKHNVTGRLSNSIDSTVKNHSLEFGSDVDYAKTIETGISVNNPSGDDIRQWAVQKVALGQASPSLISASNSIANTISASGRIKHWTPFIKPAFDSMLGETKDEISKAVIQE